MEETAVRWYGYRSEMHISLDIDWCRKSAVQLLWWSQGWVDAQTQIQHEHGDTINSLLKWAWNFSWFSHCELNYILQGMKSSVNRLLYTWRKNIWTSQFHCHVYPVLHARTSSNVRRYYKLISYTLELWRLPIMDGSGTDWKFLHYLHRQPGRAGVRDSRGFLGDEITRDREK